MKLKKIALSVALIGGIFTSGLAPVNTFAAEPSKALLQQRNDALREAILTKNEMIRKLNALIESGANLKTVNSQLSYRGNVIPRNVTIGNTAVPTLIEYNGVYYAPVQTITDMLSLPYSSDSNNVYIGTKPEGQYMMDIKSLHPFNTDWFEVNEDIVLAGETYNKGIRLKGSFSKQSYSINLGGKYTSIQGILGIEPGYNGKIEITDENDEVLYVTEIDSDDLPKKLDINVTGVNNLQIKPNAFGADIYLVNLTIK